MINFEKFNFNRKLFHLIGFFVPAILYFDFFKGTFGLMYASRAILFLVILFILISMGCIEILRLNHKDFNNFYLKYFGKIMKEAERERMNGVIPYMLSNAIIVAFFPAQIIFLSMAFLLIGDPVAAFFGASYGKYRFYNGKSLVGVAAFIIGSTIAGLILMFIFQSSYGESLFSYLKNGSFNTMAFIIIFLGGVAASLAEFFSDHALAGFLEDNLLIPIVASIVLSFLVVLFGLSNWSEIIFPITKIFS